MVSFGSLSNMIDAHLGQNDIVFKSAEIKVGGFKEC
jgi:hypothetical protein